MNYLDFTNCPSGNIIHEIEAGDTYEKLAQKYGVGVEALTLANSDKNPNYLIPGQKLIIPHPQVKSGNGILHKVTPGETYTSIAKQYNVSERELWAANTGMDLLHLQPGHVVFVPKNSDDNPCPAGTRSYTVQAGDSAYSLVCKFNTTLDALSRLNPRMNWKMVQPGSNLCVPMPWAEFIHPVFGICFMYPSHWQKITDERYEGPDGFFQISAVGGVLELDKWYQNDCCLCPGSRNHPTTVLIIPYPVHLRVGNQNCKYLALITGKSFLQEVTRTLKFVL